MKGLGNIMKEAQKLQAQMAAMQEEVAKRKVEATAGGGMVTVVMNGNKQVERITLDPSVVSKEDVEMLQDLLVAALADAHRKADEAMTQNMGGMLPPGLKIPGF